MKNSRKLTSSKTTRRDKILSFSIFLFFLIQILNASIKLVFEFSDSQNVLISNLSGIVYIGYFLFKAFPIVYRRNRNALILTYSVFLIIYVISVLLISYRGDRTDWVLGTYALWTFAFWIPIGVTSFSIHNFGVLYDLFLKYSLGLTCILVVVFVHSIWFITTEEMMFYSMSFSYFMLIPTLLHLSYYQFSRKKVYLLIAVVEICMILLIGSRGALISILMYILIKSVISKGSRNKTAWIIFIASFFALLYFNLQSINNLIIDKFGIHSRTLYKLSNPEDEQLSRRDFSWATALELIQEKPIFGYGLGGDYYPMVRKTGSSTSSDAITSPHNGLLQFMMHFGIPLGLLLGLWLIFSIGRVRQVHSFYLREFLIITYVIFIIPSMTIGDGVFIKPGVGLYVFLIFSHKFNRNSYL